MRVQPECNIFNMRMQHFQLKVIILQRRTNDRASSVLSYDQSLKYDFLVKILASINDWVNDVQLHLPGGTVTYDVLHSNKLKCKFLLEFKDLP